tara:strand:- start:135 stop:368 length:234 start_codon:yes stop_codon:yes gene_type:complete
MDPGKQAETNVWSVAFQAFTDSQTFLLIAKQDNPYPNLSLAYHTRALFSVNGIYLFFPVGSGLTFKAKLDIASGLWL